MGQKAIATGVCILHGLVAGLPGLHVALSGEPLPVYLMLCPALPCTLMPCPALHPDALPCPALPCPVPPCPVPPCPALPLSCPALDLNHVMLFAFVCLACTGLVYQVCSRVHCSVQLYLQVVFSIRSK